MYSWYKPVTVDTSKGSLMKRLLAAIIVLAMALSLCGCEKHATMTIRVHYGGYGVAGQDLGHGSYDIKIKNLREGDRIYEHEAGKLSKKPQSEEQVDNWLLKIDSIDDEYVRFTVKQGHYFQTGYEEKAIISRWVMADGMNYYYTVLSVDGGLEPFMQNW